MKIPSVHQEINMKISSIHRPKSERGRTVVIGLSQRLQPHDVATVSTVSRRRSVRTRWELTRRVIMAAVLGGSLSLKGGPRGRAGFLLCDRCRDLGLREPDHGDPATSGEEEHDH